MNAIEAVTALYNSWKEYEKFEGVSDSDIKYIFLSNAIVGLTTYDEELDLKFGKMLAETLVEIQNKTTFDYIKDETNYNNYILSCNFIKDWLEWGGSIRGAWFNTYGGKIVPSEALSNVDYDKDHIAITEDFMRWFIKFITE